ncbi:hypothetical protein, partial [Phenylobacterium sp.]|uniref:sulfotransferase-like domain-containing protein n=1 Tax=Phenylobacterium sp. TaxID=1871053 RepID=UPI0025D642D1
AAYLAETGLEHPMREEVLASQPLDWRVVAKGLAEDEPAPVYYQKHMTHHMAPGFGLDWMDSCKSAFLIREPAAVLASYVKARAEVTLADIGVVRQRELFDREADRLGRSPPVVEGADVLADPRGTLGAICVALGVPFAEAMLSWPAGRRRSDGVWAPAWYAAVERSTGFAAPERSSPAPLTDELKRIAEAARPHYEALVRWKIGPEPK